MRTKGCSVSPISPGDALGIELGAHEFHGEKSGADAVPPPPVTIQANVQPQTGAAVWSHAPAVDGHDNRARAGATGS